jgi:hypothetical protein
MSRFFASSFVLCAVVGCSCAAQPVVVTVDMDAAVPGIQSTVIVPRGTTVVRDVAVYIYDPSASHRIYGIGFIGGLNRGIALGHMPLNNHVIGKVKDMIPTLGTAAVLGNTGFADPWGIQRGFVGPEVQYIESGVAIAGSLPARPTSPQFLVDIELSDAAPGDVFPLYLLDMVTVWGGGGAFSTQSQFSFDTGGDVVPDLTRSIWGTDPDRPVAVPPAAFEVDYVDGPVSGGGARIIVEGCYADCDTSTGVGVLDIFDFLCFQDSFVSGGAYACECERFTAFRCDIFDFLCFQSVFVGGCP